MSQSRKHAISLPLPFWETGAMTERLLQYIWQFQYFNRSGLHTAAGEKLEIIFPGKLNKDQGPDFAGARIKIDQAVFAGSVELHLKTSQWKEHGHDADPNYRNVILHVVYEHNAPAALPVLELAPRIPKMLLERYHRLMHGADFIPCASSIAGTPALTWLSWKDRLVAERLTRKAATIFRFLGQNAFHWEETCWWMLARNFGATVNTDVFEAVARSLPMRLLARHKDQIHQLEALLFGQAGLLESLFKEAYPKLLQREYRFLKKKYKLGPVALPVHFLRMRPGNFPTIRLAQLAMLLHIRVHFFSRLLEKEKLEELREELAITANDYWHEHYLFDEPSSFRKKMLGKEMVDNLVINTIVPLLFAYGLHQKEKRYQEKAIQWLETTTAEQNAVTKGFGGMHIQGTSALDTQALLELKTHYCDQRRCLQCAVGNALLRS